MSRQVGIKYYFRTDKAIEPTSSPPTPAVTPAPTIPPAPSIPPTPSGSVTPSVPATPSVSETPSAASLASLKRRGSKTLQINPSQKRLRTRDASTDSGTTTASADPEDEFPDGPVSVWAMTRGDLCDSQNTFKQYQGGAQSKNNVITAVYIDKFTEPRDFLGRNKLITCSGGARIKQKGTGLYIRKDVKPRDAGRWEAALDTPIVVIMGKNHPAFQSLNLPNVVRDRGAFVELGTFMVTRVWTEMVHNDTTIPPYKVWKIMLQTMDPVSKPWYWKESSNKAQSTASRLVEGTCLSCSSTSPKIFDNAPWVCLKYGCSSFFQSGGNILPQIGSDNKELRYAEGFINNITTYKEIENIPTMFEPLQKALVNGGTNFGTEIVLRSGMTCPQCRCGSGRNFWDRLVCRNCGFEHSVSPLPYPLSLVDEETKTHTKNLRVDKDGVTITLDRKHVDKFVEEEQDGTSTRSIFMIKDNNGDLIGTLVVDRPSDLAKKSPGGADELYTSIEAEGGSMKLQRNPVRCPDSAAQQLTGHFQSNFGALYEFGQKGIDTVPFQNAPDVVLRSLVYLKHFGEKALHSSQNIASREHYRSIAGSTLHMSQKPFNELLALAYRESDHISWHDDGEDQLTGVISTASFGSPGKMSLRFKKGETILEVQLRHGDVATMCDTRLQALTDHAVDPKGLRRYAMTSRTINFDHYRQDKEEEKLVKKGLITVDEMEKAAQIPDHALQFAYNGTTLGTQGEQVA